MAKMHSRKKGRSGSKKPIEAKKLIWLRYKPKEIELLIVKLAKEGKSPSQIGLALRDNYGIPNVRQQIEKKIAEVLKEKKLSADVPEDLTSLIKSEANIKKHLELNKKDTNALRGLQLAQSKIHRLVKYYKRTKVISLDWKPEV